MRGCNPDTQLQARLDDAIITIKTLAHEHAELRLTPLDTHRGLREAYEAVLAAREAARRAGRAA